MHTATAQTLEAPGAYDSVPYPGQAVAQAHPARLATHARLFGLKAPEMTGAAVLEVGCGDGSHLLPLAAAYPAASFTGIDLSGEGIGKAQKARRRAGLSNVAFIQADLVDWSPPSEGYDYIIAHGFYSWVPAPARDRLLALVSESLRPNGVAYVSYATYPGAYLRQMTREMMRYHVRELHDPVRKQQQARALVDFLERVQPENTAYAAALRNEQRLTNRYKPEHFFHDQLSGETFACWFHEFVDHAARHGLQYLAEAQYGAMTDRAAPTAAAVLEGLRSNRVEWEQYVDFCTGRMMRQTLLCKADEHVRGDVDSGAVRRFCAAAPVRRADIDHDLDPDLESDAVAFIGLDDRPISTGNAITLRILEALGDAWPAGLSFDALRKEALQSPADEEPLVQLLLDLYADGFLYLQVSPPPIATALTGTPRASAFARVEASCGDRVTDLWHNTRVLSAEECSLLMHLDGAHDHDDLRESAQDFGLSEADVERLLQQLFDKAYIIA